MLPTPFEQCLQDLKALKEVEPTLDSDPQMLEVVRAKFFLTHSYSPAPFLEETSSTPPLLAEEKAVEISSETVVTDESPRVGLLGFFKAEYGAEPDRRGTLQTAVRNRFEAVFHKSPEPKGVWLPTGQRVPENQYPTNWLRNELESIRKTNPCHWKFCNS